MFGRITVCQISFEIYPHVKSKLRRLPLPQPKYSHVLKHTDRSINNVQYTSYYGKFSLPTELSYHCISQLYYPHASLQHYFCISLQQTVSHTRMLQVKILKQAYSEL